MPECPLGCGRSLRRSRGINQHVKRMHHVPSHQVRGVLEEAARYRRRTGGIYHGEEVPNG